jgi:hypothetical protein
MKYQQQILGQRPLIEHTFLLTGIYNLTKIKTSKTLCLRTALVQCRLTEAFCRSAYLLVQFISLKTRLATVSIPDINLVTQVEA